MRELDLMDLSRKFGFIRVIIFVKNLRLILLTDPERGPKSFTS
jgi:hypothetical protein